MRTSGSLLVSTLLLGLAIGCGENGTEADDEAGPDLPCASLAAEGWTLFESGDVDLALARFAEALERNNECAEAHNGRGWCWLRLDSLGLALADFDRALSGGVATVDPFAGQAAVYRDIEGDHFEDAVEAADSALARDARYVFSHDTTFCWKDLRLILAQSYFALGLYESANGQVDSLGGIAQDVVSETFVMDLLAEIQRLRENRCSLTTGGDFLAAGKMALSRGDPHCGHGGSTK